MNNGDQYDIEEDFFYAHIVNRYGKGMTAGAIIHLSRQSFNWQIM
ncbi:hypothetical protein [Paenibacillus sp. FSL R7-0337]|nr:hypothetical protein [Paenibacillus sp. FSL R7-0337]